jgi:hypothetical protein
MKKVFYLIACVALLASCADQYNIQGSSTVSVLDGSKLYLKVLKDTDLTSLDSCEVVHGQFHFAGLLDTTYMASLYMGEQSIMPLVVEKGDIVIRIDNAQQKVTGTALNDVLYDFLDKHNRLQNQMAELDHRFSQMLLDGIDEDEINRTLSAEAAVIAQQEDSLVSDFVAANFENVLGPFVFIQMTSSVPQVEHLMSKAPESFKRNEAVAEFYKHVTDTGLTHKVEPAPTAGSDAIDDATIQNILNGNGNAD